MSDKLIESCGTFEGIQLCLPLDEFQKTQVEQVKKTNICKKCNELYPYADKVINFVCTPCKFTF